MLKGCLVTKDYHITLHVILAYNVDNVIQFKYYL